jgi:hypothetical protein
MWKVAFYPYSWYLHVSRASLIYEHKICGQGDRRIGIKVKVKVIWRPTVSWQGRLGVRHPFGTGDQFFFLLEIFFRQLRVCYFVAASLTRGRVCNLLLMLVLASAVPRDSRPYFIVPILETLSTFYDGSYIIASSSKSVIFMRTLYYIYNTHLMIFLSQLVN